MASARGHEGLISVPDQDPTENNQQDHLLYHLVNTSTRPYGTGFSVNAPSQQTTGFATTAPLIHSNRQDLLSDWTASFTAYYPKTSPVSGHLGDVTFASGSIYKVESYSLNFAQEEMHDTGMASTSPTWREYQPGLWTVTGTMRMRVDSTGTGAVVGARGSATFRLSDDDTDNTVAGSIALTSVSKDIRIGQQVFRDVGFIFEGQATSAGTSTMLPAGTLDEPELTYVNIRSTGSRIDSGFCFVSGLSVNVAIGQPIEVSGTLRGSGALTPA
jgi:hypothetical protein